jgi:hypothetical protein
MKIERKGREEEIKREKIIINRPTNPRLTGGSTGAMKNHTQTQHPSRVCY